MSQRRRFINLFLTGFNRRTLQFYHQFLQRDLHTLLLRPATNWRRLLNFQEAPEPF